MSEERKIIDEANYSQFAPREAGPAAIGRGGDPLFVNLKASKSQLEELLDETSTVQDWLQREACNNVALSCLNNENLKDVYFEIKDGFGEFGPMLLMGFKTPQGVEIPRLKLLDKDGSVIEVLTGPLAIDELNKRALAFKDMKNGYEKIEVAQDELEESLDLVEEIQEYS